MSKVGVILMSTLIKAYRLSLSPRIISARFCFRRFSIDDWEPELFYYFEKVKDMGIAPNTELLFHNTVNLREFPPNTSVLFCSTRNCGYHTACLKTSLLSHLPCLNKVDWLIDWLIGSVLTEPDFLHRLKSCTCNFITQHARWGDSRLS